MRTLCVWYPEWPLGRPDAPSDRPCLVIDPPEAGVARVAAASAAARTAGVRLGMPRREAEGLCPGAAVLSRDLGEETRRFEPVVLATEETVPRVEVVAPGTMLIPVAGAVRYYGGEGPLVEIITGKLGTMEGSFQVGLADGPFAAGWAARLAEPGRPNLITDTREFLAGLDVSALMERDLRVESLVDTFRWLGVTTLGSLAELPRAAVASRFGEVGLSAHRLAHGEDRQVDARRIPPELAVESRFEEPLELADQVAFAARALASRLMTGLRREGIAPHRIAVEVEASDGAVRTRVWRSADPFSEQALAERVWWQLRAWIEQPVGGHALGAIGITRLRLDPSDLSGEGRQLAFFEETGEGWVESGAAALTARIEAERALARAQALVGPDAVLSARPQGGRMPGERVAWRRWDEEEPTVEESLEAPWPGATPSPTPALVPPEQSPLEVEWEDGTPARVRLGTRWEPVLTWSGPWRLTGRWWRGEGAVDRYQFVTSAGAFLCVVQDGRCFLTGVYD